MTTTVTTAWPDPGAVASLRWSLSTASARVLRRTEDSLTLAAVLPRGARPLPRVGGALTVQWSDANGLHERPVEVTSHRGGLLHVAPSDEARTIQRRQFYRAPVTIDLTITAGDTVMHGVTVDMSEGGTRVALEGGHLLPRSEVMTTLRVEGGPFKVPCTVVRHEDKGHRAEVGLQFGDLPEAAADVIRKHVFTAQVEARRKGIRS